ncbi:MAG: N-acetyltransferase family protein [Solirubrobacterales bacterium]
MTQNAAKIRLANRRDIPDIVRLWEELMDFHRKLDPFFTRARNSADLFRRFLEQNLENDAACVLVAQTEDGIVGYCQGMLEHHPPAVLEPDYGLVLDFAVTAAHRHSGIGRQMFEALCKWFRREGVHRIEVRHSTFNPLAASFWPKMGFKPYLQTLFMELDTDHDSKGG